MDARLKSLEDDIAKLKNLEGEVLWLRSVLETLGIVVEDGVAFATIGSWLRDSKEVCKKKLITKVVLIDRHPYYNDSRNIWYYYRNYGDKQLDPNTYEGNCYNVPSSWDMPTNKTDTTKRYYDDNGISGWDTKESAEQALSYGALKWAKDD